MPKGVLERAEEMLRQLEEANRGEKKAERPAGDGYQLSFIQLDDPLLQQIKEDILNIEINLLTPVEALMKLNEIKKLLEKR